MASDFYMLNETPLRGLVFSWRGCLTQSKQTGCFELSQLGRQKSFVALGNSGFRPLLLRQQSLNSLGEFLKH